jgi:hypothetical protein
MILQLLPPASATAHSHHSLGTSPICSSLFHPKMKTDLNHSEHNETVTSSLGDSNASFDSWGGASYTESQSKINKTEDDKILQQGGHIGESQRPRRGLLRNATVSCRAFFKRDSTLQPLHEKKSTASSCHDLFKRDSTSHQSLREKESGESSKTAPSSRPQGLMQRQQSGRSQFSYNKMKHPSKGDLGSILSEYEDIVGPGESVTGW